ncbi:hypothetical protein PSSHI_26420 [Photobacterium sp. R1]
MNWCLIPQNNQYNRIKTRTINYFWVLMLIFLIINDCYTLNGPGEWKTINSIATGLSIKLQGDE